MTSPPPIRNNKLPSEGIGLEGKPQAECQAARHAVALRIVGNQLPRRIGHSRTVVRHVVVARQDRNLLQRPKTRRR